MREPHPTPATVLVDVLVARYGKARAAVELDAILDTLPVVELAALAYDWTHFWARPKQLPPPGAWRSWGFLTARAVGKTTTVSQYIAGEAEAGRAMSIGLAAQNEERTIAVQVGSLTSASPPWCRPEWSSTSKVLVWPNGAVAHAHTPEVPGAIRGGGTDGKGFDLAWLSEVQSWPTATRREAYLNFQFATRLGYARTVWDATPKRRHPMLNQWIARSATEPDRHVIVRGTIYENVRNLSAGVIEDLEREWGGTLAGREELLGEMLSESESALIRQAWIDAHRRHLPEGIRRRVLGIDPAVTSRAGNDRTGIVDVGVGVDGQAYVLGDYSGKHTPSAWGTIVLEQYVRNACDCVIVETNKGGELVTQNLRAHAGKRGLQIVVVGKDERTRHTAGTVHVKEVHARGPKEDRAQPLATAYERGRVSHVIGVDLASLEDTLTTWEPAPGQRSPDALDALVHAVGDLLEFGANKVDPSLAFRGLTAANKALAQGGGPGRSVSRVFGGGGGGRI